jgi:integrase
VKAVVQATVLTPAQIALLVKNLLSPYREMCLLAATTGLRPSELWGLRWQDVDERGVHVRQRLYRRHVGPTKTTKAVRDIPLAPEVFEQVNRLRQEPDSLVFHGAKGGPVRSDEIMAVIRPIATKLGLPHFVWQSFRRSAETMMHNNGIPLKTQQAMLGHSNVNMTLHYAEAGEGGKEKAAELLGALTCASVAQVSERPV